MISPFAGLLILPIAVLGISNPLVELLISSIALLSGREALLLIDTCAQILKPATMLMKRISRYFMQVILVILNVLHFYFFTSLGSGTN